MLQLHSLNNKLSSMLSCGLNSEPLLTFCSSPFIVKLTLTPVCIRSVLLLVAWKAKGRAASKTRGCEEKQNELIPDQKGVLARWSWKVKRAFWLCFGEK